MSCDRGAAPTTLPRSYKSSFEAGVAALRAARCGSSTAQPSALFYSTCKEWRDRRPIEGRPMS